MEFDEYSKIFFRMEMEERLFTMRTPYGDPFWDVVRLEVYISLFQEVNKCGQFRYPSERRSLQGWLSAIHTLPLKIRSMASQWLRLKRMRPTDYVAYINSRYKDVNGKPVDFASDDALHILSEFGSILRVESAGCNMYQDVQYGTLLGAVGRAYRLPAGYEQYFREITAKTAAFIRTYFGVTDPSLPNVIRRTYKSHLVERRIWRYILDRARPRLVLLTQNGVQKGLILEAQKRNIALVECQHGNISLMHPAYSYPPSLPPGEGVLLPEALLLLSEHWEHQCYMPGTKLVVVGNSHLSCTGANSTRTGAAVFVSGGPFHKYLSTLALEVAQSLPNRAFIMKLHPSWLSDRAMIERGYAGTTNLTVVGAEKSISQLMEDASDMIVGQSTAVYEALDRGVPVHIPRIDGYTWHKDVFSRSDVYLFSTADELKSTLFKTMNYPSNSPRYFNDFDPVALRMIIDILQARYYVLT